MYVSIRYVDNKFNLVSLNYKYCNTLKHVTCNFYVVLIRRLSNEVDKNM